MAVVDIKQLQRENMLLSLAFDKNEIMIQIAQELEGTRKLLTETQADNRKLSEQLTKSTIE